MHPITLDFSGIEPPREDKSAATIWDIVRQKAVKADPEERVRQYLLRYFISRLGYPRTLIAVEKALQVGELLKRTDIVVYNRNTQPVMIVECKAPSVKLNQQVFDQAGRYNISLRVPWLVISNGAETYCARIDLQQQSFTFRHALPDFHELCTISQ